ncbi:hypothetical protein M758_2G076900 [Ceratodon purpureus]|nr:hypothetical protein M758_2G076900 [Ceratodon purpureus]
MARELQDEPALNDNEASVREPVTPTTIPARVLSPTNTNPPSAAAHHGSNTALSTLSSCAKYGSCPSHTGMRNVSRLWVGACCDVTI